MTDSFLVYDGSSSAPTLIGSSFVSRRRGRLSVTFTYDRTYLARKDAYPIDPALPLRAGGLHADGLPGAFADSAPDRWGRDLIAKRERGRWAPGGGRPPALDDVAYLLAVSDGTRQGALRFATAQGGDFLAPHVEIPRLVELPALLAAADEVGRGDDDWRAIKALLDAGTGSLGGARPKASVRDGDVLMIAKFPHHGDEWDVMAWEWVALELAARAGIAVPRHRLVDVGGQRVHLVERFDRVDGGRRPYISGMTLVESRDGDHRDYVEVAEAMSEHGAGDPAELAGLYRRIALSVAIRNTDDHLRNLGYLRSRRGWELAPAFDLNPDPHPGASRATSIAGTTDPGDEDTALRDAGAYFGLSPQAAKQVRRDVAEAAAGWREVATAAQLSEKEMGMFGPVLDEALERVR